MSASTAAFAAAFAAPFAEREASFTLGHECEASFTLESIERSGW